jgi:hypothetical protein
LVARRQWRALGGAVIAVTLLVLVSVLVFGFSIWIDFLASIPSTMRAIFMFKTHGFSRCHLSMLRFVWRDTGVKVPGFFIA